jgi:hypothetical protein
LNNLKTLLPEVFIPKTKYSRALPTEEPRPLKTFSAQT